MRRSAWPALLGALLVACGNTSHQNTPVFLAHGGSSSGGTGGASAGVAGETAATEAVEGVMHRLTRFEYESTVTDILGTTAPALSLSEGNFTGFATAANLRTSDDDYAQFYEAARTEAHAVLMDSVLRARVVPCQEQTSDCVASMVQSAGLKLFRRPLQEEERAVYAKLFSQLIGQQLSYDAALEQVLVALLASAQFLYHMEFPDEQGPEPLSPYEQASRLSYLLWSSAPDDNLLEAARLSELSEDEQLEVQLTRMWNDARSARFVQSFAGQWLGARRLYDHAVQPSVYPSWSPALADAAARELYERFDTLLHSDGDFLDLYRPTAHDVDALLAPLYGVTPDPGASTVRVEGERASFLGSIAYLTVTSFDLRTSPTQRGKFILENVLCQPLPPPPPGVVVDVQPPAASFRECIDRIRADAHCAPCHALMDPIGLSLEHFDGIGQYRVAYSSGEPIDSHLTLAPSPGHPAGLQVEGISGIVERVTTDPATKRCAAEKLYAFATGSTSTEVDRQNIDTLADDWERGPLTIKELVRQLVLSNTFRSKRAWKVP